MVGTISKLEDITVYTEAISLCHEVYSLTTQIRSDFSLVDQMRRAAISVAANIAEGYGRKSRKDFSQFLSISLGSANELMAYFDFIELEFNISTSELKNKYTILSKKIYSLRAFLITHPNAPNSAHQ